MAKDGAFTRRPISKLEQGARYREQECEVLNQLYCNMRMRWHVVRNSANTFTDQSKTGNTTRTNSTLWYHQSHTCTQRAALQCWHHPRPTLFP
jgi:hypothetical protein